MSFFYIYGQIGWSNLFGWNTNKFVTTIIFGTYIFLHCSLLTEISQCSKESSWESKESSWEVQWCPASSSAVPTARLDLYFMSIAVSCSYSPSRPLCYEQSNLWQAFCNGRPSYRILAHGAQRGAIEIALLLDNSSNQ